MFGTKKKKEKNYQTDRRIDVLFFESIGECVNAFRKKLITKDQEDMNERVSIGIFCDQLLLDVLLGIKTVKSV